MTDDIYQKITDLQDKVTEYRNQWQEVADLLDELAMVYEKGIE